MPEVWNVSQPQPLWRFLRPDVLVSNLWRERAIIRQLTTRNVLARYRGSALGVLWSLLLPLAMLLVYTFVFGVVLKSRWPNRPDEPTTMFAITLFSGMLVFSVFSETLGAAPQLVVGNPSYVKRVVFPLETLIVCTLGPALLQALISVAILLVFTLIFTGTVPWSAVFFPLVFLPLCGYSLGFGWILASLGVYVRDLTQGIGVVLQVLMFLTPIFYTIEQIQNPWFRGLMLANPLTPIVENARAALVWGQLPDFGALLLSTGGALLVMQFGYAFFMKTRKGFADVL